MSWPTTILAAIAGFKTVAVLLLATPLLSSERGDVTDGVQFLIKCAPWLLPGVVLLLANSRQMRTGSLGVAMLLVGNSYYAAAWHNLTIGGPLMGWLVNVAPGVFTPYYFGRFLLDFPQPRTGRSARWLTLITRLAGIVGCLRFGALLAAPFFREANPPTLFLILTGDLDLRLWPTVTYGLSVLILILSFAELQGALPADRRRHQRLFPGWILIIGAITVLLLKVAGGTATGRMLVLPRPFGLLVALASFGAVVGPGLVMYRIFEGRRWAMRDAIRRATYLAFDRRWLATLTIVPVVVLMGVAYVRQDQRVADVFSRTAIAWAIVATLSAFSLYWRRRFLHGFNRWFFRESPDSGRALAELTNRMRQSHGIDELVAHLTAGIDRAFRPYRVVVLVRDESATQFVPLFGSAEPLPASALLVELLTSGRGALDTPLSEGHSPMRWLPQDERYWLVDSGARLLVPLHASDGSLNGLIAVGDRRSGQAYSDDDRTWLTAVAESVTLTIEAQVTAVRGAAASTPDHAWRVGLVQRHARALECHTCGHVEEAGAVSCRHCASPLAPSLVPQLLFGKFRFEQRIGRGAMGVVYRATDLALERQVAIKMLPGSSPEYSELLRIEARAMASVTHRHLAVVYGVEAWRGQPLLVCEYMAAGTLADRLTRGPLPLNDALSLGVALGDALTVIHDRGMLHRDIKPSNIGYDRANVPKLLDFGLAQLLSTTTRLPENLRPEHHQAGTPLYMSPESIDGQAPSHAVDLWSLHVLLYEAITGQHPFRRNNTGDTMRAIRQDSAPKLTLPQGVSMPRADRLTAYFAAALSPDPSARPRSAVDAVAALRTLIA